jgi:hypothetical protein
MREPSTKVALETIDMVPLMRLAHCKASNVLSPPYPMQCVAATVETALREYIHVQPFSSPGNRLSRTH